MKLYHHTHSAISLKNPPVRVNRRREMPFVTLALTLLAAIATIHCGSSSSTSPTTTPAVSAVALNASTIAVSSSGQGTVSLAAATSAAATITLTSSNPAVATVQSPITVPAGSASAAFTVTGMGIGTAVITASLNGSSSQSPMLTVIGQIAVLSISLNTASVVGGNPVTGTVSLTAAAPAGGAAVALSATDPVTVPATVTVPAGTSNATFGASTKAVGGTVAATITGSYGGASASATLSVTKPSVATASFGVTGPSETETCELANNGTTINCTFNGSTSTAPGTITAWDWTYGVATTFSQTTTGPQLTMPTVNCSLLPLPPLPPGNPWFTMIVTLVVHDSQGNVSTKVTDSGVRLLPQGSCGF
jgi:hypothetical protein